MNLYKTIPVFLFLIFTLLSCKQAQVDQSLTDISSKVIVPGACSGNGDGNQPLPLASGNNVINFQISGDGICGINQPCTSVTICEPANLSNCQTIDNILIDTTSFGLRIFQSVVHLNLDPVLKNSKPIAECAQFGSENFWGPVMGAQVGLGNEPMVNVSIQLFDNSYATLPSNCNFPSIPVDTPTVAGFNGILGIGVNKLDCGSLCSSNVTNGVYFQCDANASGSNCIETNLVISNQVANPVAKLPVDNNGIILQLPSIDPNGMGSISGNLILGIDTEANNVSNLNIHKLSLDSFGSFSTLLNGVAYTASSFDSTSIATMFSKTDEMSYCSTQLGFYCPSTTACYTANIQSNLNANPSSNVNFVAANIESLTADALNNAFNDLAGETTNANEFVWGLPFFYGRSIYIGINGQSSGLGVGPYYGY